ncbi:MAG: OB-fold nucleic acid binding domain-containing protein, partial [Tepidisphaeraceae bacterium]
VFNQLGGIELSAAYKLIKAISKKTADVIAKYKPDFLRGAVERGISKSQAEEIFELILKFGGYGFNKSHSTRYAIIAFQTAFMKTYHPVEYMSALLTFEMGNTDKVVEYIEECRRLTLPDGSKGVRVLPPDVNHSDKDFTPVYGDDPRGVIRFGLCAVRGVGEKAVEAIVTERASRGPFTSLYDFCERVDLRAVQASTIEALIKCGAFAGLGANRAQLLQVFQAAVAMGQQTQQDIRAGQLSMFGAATGETTRTSAAPLPDVPEFASGELLKFEKELLGFYVTSHPLTEHHALLERYATAATKQTLGMPENTEVTVGGMVTRVKRTVAKTGRSAGQPMAMITLEDLEGQIEGVLFADTYADVLKRFPDALALESIVFVRGKIDRRRETPCVVVNDVVPLEQSPQKLTTAVALKLDRVRHDAAAIDRIAPLLARHKGNVDLFAQVETVDAKKVVIKIRRELSVRPTLQ